MLWHHWNPPLRCQSTCQTALAAQMVWQDSVVCRICSWLNIIYQFTICISMCYYIFLLSVKVYFPPMYLTVYEVQYRISLTLSISIKQSCYQKTKGVVRFSVYWNTSIPFLTLNPLVRTIFFYNLRYKRTLIYWGVIINKLKPWHIIPPLHWIQSKFTIIFQLMRIYINVKQGCHYRLLNGFFFKLWLTRFCMS